MDKVRYPNRLKKFRRMAGYSQKKVARLLGFADTSTISRWEHGITAPNIIQLLWLAKLYHCLPHEFYPDLWNVIAPDLLTQHESFTSQHHICL
ncbi:MAG: helix-turn-helix transcriptional regulator [Bacteroidetes bacterium]|nr:helix-turn-helix transcriptional regulator [Bacteroidota bacterium]